MASCFRLSTCGLPTPLPLVSLLALSFLFFLFFLFFSFLFLPRLVHHLWGPWERALSAPRPLAAAPIRSRVSLRTRISLPCPRGVSPLISFFFNLASLSRARLALGRMFSLREHVLAYPHFSVSFSLMLAHNLSKRICPISPLSLSPSIPLLPPFLFPPSSRSCHPSQLIHSRG